MKKKKYNLGGPVPPKDTTRVESKPLLVIPTTTYINPEASSKEKSKDRFREKSQGGQLLTAGVSMIPGYGQMLAPIVGLIDQQMDKDKLEQAKPVPAPKMNMNPFGTFADGGVLNDKFKQYSTGSHSSGNDLQVDAQGNPNPNGENAVQNKENSFDVDGVQYVFSDVLKKNGTSFNIHAGNINKKYPKARFDSDQKNALNLEMKMLSKDNDVKRGEVESKQFAKGGKLYNGGDPSVPASNNLAWESQSINPITLPTLALPQSVNSDQLDFRAMDNSNPVQGLDTTSFGQELNVGKNLTEPGVQSVNSTDRGNPILAKPGNSNNLLSPQGANAIGLGLKGAALAGSLIDATRGAEKENLVLPDYRKADNYMQSANIDYSQAKQDAQGISNIAGATNRSLSSNAASYQSREMARLGQLSDQLGRISEAENNANSQLNLTKGNYETGKAVDTANRTYQNNTDNLQNQANSRFFGRTLGSELSQIGTEFNKYANQTKENQNNKEVNQFQVNQSLAILNSKYPDFQITPEVMELLKTGASVDEIIKMKK